MDNLQDRVGVPSVTIDWYRSLPWWPLCSRAITTAWRLSHLVVGTVAAMLVTIGWNVADSIFGDPTSVFQSASLTRNPISGTWQNLTHALFAFREGGGFIELARILLGGLWTVVVCAGLGGLLARRSVYEMSTQSPADWGTTLRLVKSRFTSLLWTLVMPWSALVVLLIPVLVLGLLGRLGSVGVWIAGLAMIPMVLLMIGAGWLALLGALGFPLAVTAVVAEKQADAFDGFSRSAAYLYQRPFTFGLGVALANLVAWGAAFAVDFAMKMGLQVVFAAFELASARPIHQDGLRIHFGFAFAEDFMQLVIAGFVFSFFWSAAAALYLTLRHEIDHTDMDEIDLFEKQPAKSIPSIGSPPSPENNPALSGVHEQAE